ncbi:MAG: polysaccharide biosynthesis C-terminal domain-containing protein [Clostridiales bacterium]|nr:polysaccharide biosynthesis C-terminal domain-containing protein [Clostridiales bacterium]
MKKETDKKEIFESLPVAEAVRLMATPMVISMVIVLIYNMADTFYVGRTNDPYMVAGISMMLPVFNITLSIAGISGVGGGTLVSRLLGREEEREARRVSVFSIYLAVLLAACFSVGMACFLDPLLRAMGAGDNTIAYARQYTFCVLVIGGIPTVLSNVLSNLVRCVGYSKKASFGIAMGGVLNIVLDPLLMFVILPHGMEVLGVGIATCISNCVACLYFLITVYRTREEHVICLDPREGMPTGESICSVLQVGIPSSVTTLLFDLDYVVLDRLMVTYGDIPLAAIGIVLKAERFPLNVGIGICQGMVPLVAYNFASGDHQRMNQVIHCARRAGLLIGLASILVYEIFAVSLMRIFIANADTVSLGTTFIRIRILATPMMFLCFSMVHVFNAFGEGGWALLLGVLRWAVINIPMLFLLNALFGIYGLVWSQLISDAVMAAISFCVYRIYARKAFQVQG